MRMLLGWSHCPRRGATIHPTLEFFEGQQKYASSKRTVFDAEGRVRSAKRRKQI